MKRAFRLYRASLRARDLDPRDRYEARVGLRLALRLARLRDEKWVPGEVLASERTMARAEARALLVLAASAVAGFVGGCSRAQFVEAAGRAFDFARSLIGARTGRFPNPPLAQGSDV